MKTQFIFSFFLLFFSCTKVSNELCSFESNYEIRDFYGFQAYTNIEDGLKCSAETGKPIFLLFTGFTLGDTSHVEYLFLKRRCRKILSQNYVPVILYVDDPKEIPESLRKKMNLGKEDYKIKNFGRYNRWYQMKKFEVNYQPFLVILDSNGSTLINPIDYQSDKENYAKFLLKGLEEYKAKE